MEEYKRIHLIELKKEWDDPEISRVNPGPNGGMTVVRKAWMDLHDFRSHTVSEVTYDTFDYDAALAWCTEHHYALTRNDTVETVFVHDSCPDRIDFAASGAAVRAVHLDRRGMNDVPREAFLVDTAGRTLKEICDWLEEHGYTTYWWGSGARAFRGTPWPIRTRREIFRKRQQLEEVALYLLRTDPGRWHNEETLLSLDLAYAG